MSRRRPVGILHKAAHRVELTGADVAREPGKAEPRGIRYTAVPRVLEAKRRPTYLTEHNDL